MSNWYAIQTKVKKEAIAEQQLVNQAFTIFLPWLRINKLKRGRWQSSVEPLFPGYLFVELDFERQNTAAIRSTRGVVGLVRQGTTPASVPNGFVQSLMRSQSVSGNAIDASRLFEPGEEVILTNGPMKGLKAIFKSQNSLERVVLLLNILGNETLVSVSPSILSRSN